MIVGLVFVFALAASVIFLQERSHRITLNNTISGYENSLAWERTRVDNLIVQVQANSQGLQHYPMIGPFDAPEPDRLKRIMDETGLIEVEFDPDNDDLFADSI